MRRTLLLAFALMTSALHAQGPATTANDDSCDIGVAPAATLLLPYFEVDALSPSNSARTTLFTIVNTSVQPQIAKITLWTDWAYPALTFNAYLTGYGVASVNLRDVFVRGTIAPGSGVADLRGSRSEGTNVNHLPGVADDCSMRQMTLTPTELAALVRLFQTGQLDGTTARVGGTHTNLIGYATIDVVATCSATLPTNPLYYASEILFDNVLTGDWMLIDPSPLTGNYAGGNPLVHIRAIPEGGPAGSSVATNLPYTFYDRYTTIGGMYARTVDRRQPLASTFAARWIQGGATSFDTSFIIWREGYTGANAAVSRYADNNAKEITELVRFDEHENSIELGPPGVIICTPLPQTPSVYPATSSLSTSSSQFPGLTPSGDVGGWMYINASNHGSPVYSAAAGRNFQSGSSTNSNCLRQNQDWVVVYMHAEGRFAVLFDAAQLGNGCSKSPAPDTTIGPAPNITP